jgi:predicted DNA-binding helix-hairpin-helix protein
MEILEKAKVLSSSGRYDSCGPKMCEVKVDSGLGGIYYAKAEHKSCKIFKTLMENSCSFDCKYCGNARGCTKSKASYEPGELAKVFNHLQTTLDVNGLFLSSAVAGDPDRVTEKMIEAVRIVRQENKFNGYVHFKVLPGTSYELIKQAAELSDRMSINIEAPNREALNELSSCKEYRTDILKRQAWISRLGLESGQTTQMIVNRLSTDKDILRMADWEYTNLDLRRMYYSAFRPVAGTPLEDEKAEPLFRQNHLYNADFLIRQYDYSVKEFNGIMDEGMLPNEDPKLAIAKASFDGAVDINEAGFEELIRIPGIGPKTAKRIVDSREAGSTGNGGKITKYEQLKRFGGWIERAKPFIEVDGKRQTMLMEF